jgi:hypothetical protein
VVHPDLLERLEAFAEKLSLLLVNNDIIADKLKSYGETAGYMVRRVS